MADGGGPLTIAVLVKQVPDTNALRIDKGTGKPLPGGQLVVNSYDLHAIEAALQFKEARGGEVVVLSAGPASVRDALTRALAMGADRAVHVELADPAALDTLAVARVLTEQVRPLSPDLVLAGQTADDWEDGQVGPQVAELLDLPLVSNVVAIEDGGRELTITRDMEDGYQTVRAPLPALLLASTGLNEPRLPSLKGIMAAKKKLIEPVAAAASNGAGLSWSEPLAPRRSSSGIVLQDVPAAEAARQLVAWLQEQKLL